MFKHKIGVCYTSKFGKTAGELFPFFKSLGFDNTFAMYNAEKGISGTEEIANAAAKSGLFLESLHAPFNKINDIWKVGDEGEICLSELCGCIEACAKFDIPIAVVHISSGENAPFINDLGHSRFDRLVECAVKSGVTVAFENQRKLANLAFALEIYDNVPNVGFCWDMGHEACFTHGMEFMPLFGKKLVYTHIHDNFSQYNEDLHMIPFDGNIDFRKCAQHIRNSGYIGSLTLETAPKSGSIYENMSAQEFYRRAYDSIVKFRSMVEE